MSSSALACSLAAAGAAASRSRRAPQRRAAVRVCAGPGKLTLYTNPRSRSQIVEWYAKECNLDYDVVEIDMAKGEHKQAAYTAINPFGKLPAIKCADGTPVFESGAILLYMAERYGGLDTPERRASAAQWVLFANSTYSSVAFSANQRAQQLPALCDSLNAVLSKSKYLLGDTFSVADVAMGAYLAYTCMFFADVSFRKWPAITKYMEDIEKRPAFAATIGSE